MPPPKQQAEKKPSALQRLKATMGSAVNATLQYGKDVATGKKLIEGLKQNDGALDGWLSHGANEAATVLLTGNPAPVYTRSMSPLDQDIAGEASPDIADPESAGAPEPANDIRSHQAAKAATHHEVTVNQNAGEDMQQTFFQSSLSNLMDRVRSLSPTKQPEMEMSQ